MRALAWVLMLCSLLLTAWAHMGPSLDGPARRRLISISLFLLAVGLAVGAASGDL